jgi:hypothetical protein
VDYELATRIRRSTDHGCRNTSWSHPTHAKRANGGNSSKEAKKNHDLTAHHLIPKGHRSCACRKAPPPPCMLLLLSEEHRERLRCNSASASQHVSDWPCAALPDRPGGKASSTRGTGQSGASDQQAPVACLRRRVRPPSAGRRVALRRNCNVRMLAAGARWSAGPWANGRAERGSLAALHAAPAPAPDGGVGRRWAQAAQPRAGRRCCCAAVFWPAPWISAVSDRRCCSRGDRAPWCGGAVWVKAVRDAAGPGVRLLCCARNSGVLSVGDGWVDGCGVAGWGTPCSLGLSATSQQYFSLRTNQPPATSQNQPALLFSQNKPAPAISHQPTEHANGVPPPDLPRFHHTAAQSQRMGPARLVSPSSFTRGISSTCS